jgi:hypothetical protein
LGDVHFERVGPRTFTFTSTSTLDPGSLASSFTFFCTFDSSPRVDHGRVGSGVRTLKLTVSAVFVVFPFFLCSIILLYLLASSCVRVCSFSSFFLSRRFGSQFVIPLPNRRSFKNQVLGCQLANSDWTLGRDYKGVVLLCCTIRSEPLLPCNGEASP